MELLLDLLEIVKADLNDAEISMVATAKRLGSHPHRDPRKIGFVLLRKTAAGVLLRIMRDNDKRTD